MSLVKGERIIVAMLQGSKRKKETMEVQTQMKGTPMLYSSNFTMKNADQSQHTWLLYMHLLKGGSTLFLLSTLFYPSLIITIPWPKTYPSIQQQLKAKRIGLWP